MKKLQKTLGRAYPHTVNQKCAYLFAIISIILMSICSYTSPLFYFDDSPDNNTFFTVGKAMMHGIVPYKDVFEQKGPYLYLVHGLASLVAYHSLWGMFPVEIISLFFTMWFTYKMSYIFEKKYLACVIALFVPILYFFHPYYNYGDTAESLIFPFTTYLIYITIEYERNHFRLSDRQWSILGILVGISFLVKYTLLGCWIVFYLFTLGLYANDKKWSLLKKEVKFSLYGFLIAVVPWLFYFILTDSLGDFFKVYFVDNIFKYSNYSAPIVSKLLESLTIYSQFLRSNVIICLIGLVSLIFILSSKVIFKTYKGKILYLLMNLFCAIFATYGYQSGMVYQYYELAIFPFFIIPLAGFIAYIVNQRIHLGNMNHHKIMKTIGLSIAISFVILMGVNNNVLSSRLYPNNASVTKDVHIHSPRHPAQVDFGKIIRSQTGPHSTLLNYGSIDMGFYTTSGILPHNYYFQDYNFSQSKFPQIINSQRSIIKHRKTEWVVLDTKYGTAITQWNGDPSEPSDSIESGNLNTGTKGLAPYLLKNYRIVANHLQSFENENINYWLLKKRKHPLSHAELTYYLEWNREHEQEGFNPDEP